MLKFKITTILIIVLISTVGCSQNRTDIQQNTQVQQVQQQNVSDSALIQNKKADSKPTQKAVDNSKKNNSNEDTQNKDPLKLENSQLKNSQKQVENKSTNNSKKVVVDLPANIETKDPKIENYDYTYDFELNNLDGQKVKLSDYKGKTVVINFWTTWCPYCVKELPDLQVLNEELKADNKAAFFAVNIQESKDLIQIFLERKALNIPVLLDLSGEVSNKYGVEGIPATFIIGPDGSIVQRFTGTITKEEVKQYIK